MALNGMMNGLVVPALATLLSLRAPSGAQSTAFGLSATASALGYTVGPLLSGGVAAAAGASLALIAVAGVSALCVAVLLGSAREPAVLAPGPEGA
jgi:MFS family permease